MQSATGSDVRANRPSGKNESAGNTEIQEKCGKMRPCYCMYRKQYGCSVNCKGVAFGAAFHNVGSGRGAALVQEGKQVYIHHLGKGKEERELQHRWS